VFFIFVITDQLINSENMKKLILLLFIPLVMNAQQDKFERQELVDDFIKAYNDKDYQSVFELFSAEMKTALPKKRLKNFLKNLNSTAGKISENNFLRIENNVVLYKLTFENWVSQYSFSFNDENEISDVFYFDDFQEPALLKSAICGLPENEKTISNTQSELIFEKTKQFPNSSELSLAFINGDNVNYYGVIRQNDSIIYINNSQHIFEIGSITKLFTANLLAKAVVDNRIKFDENINDYLRIKINKNTKISFKSLANHTSGLPRMPSNFGRVRNSSDNPYKHYNQSYLEDYLKNFLKLDKKAIGIPSYSNLGFAILGYTIGKIYEMSYEDLIQKFIFSKFEMNSSFLNADKVDNRLVKGLNKKGEVTSNWDLSAMSSAGGILSNIEDLVKFGKAHFDESNIALNLLKKKTAKINEKIDIGIGWHIINSEKSENKWHWHNGGTGGYSSSMALDFKNKTGVIVLSNVSAFNPYQDNIDQLCFELMKTLKDVNGVLYYE